MVGYEVVPRPRQRRPNSRPDEWVLKKGASTVRTFQNKLNATQRGKELAKKNNTTLVVFDAAKKSSRSFDYRTQGDKRAATSRANRKALDREMGNFRL